MQAASAASLIEEQLDLTLRQILGTSASITPSEIKSICRRLSQMYHTMAHLLVVKTLESDGVALTDHLGLVGVEGSSSNITDVPDDNTTDKAGQDPPALRKHDDAPQNHGRTNTPVIRVNRNGSRGPVNHQIPVIDADDYSDDAPSS